MSLVTAAEQVKALLLILGAIVFGWKSIDMAMKERYSTAIALFLAAAMFGAFSIGGDAVFKSAYCMVWSLFGGSCAA